MSIRRKLLCAAAAALLAGVFSGAPPALAVAGPVAAAPPVHCVGNGTDGDRLQLVYAYEAGTPNRLAEREPTIRLAAWVAQQNVNDSARQDGAQRWLRFVSSATGCQVTIVTIQVPAGSSNAYYVTWRNTLKSAGLNASNRIYEVYAEGLSNACAYTDSGDVPNDSTPSTANTHNSNPAWSSFSPGCFGGQAMVHEFAHALGAMSAAMPHNDGASHCTDGVEALCGADAATLVCPDPMHARLLDCGEDDYFGINPQGGYLPSHFNGAYHSLYIQAGTATTVQAAPQPLPPQLLRASDVEGTSITFSWVPTVAPNGSQSLYTLQYELLRNGSVVATTPQSRPFARVTGLVANSAASYAVRTRYEYGGSTRTSAGSTALSVTTNSSSTPAGGAADGATMILTNDLTGNNQPLAMDVYNHATDDNAPIKQWDQTSDTNQQWKMTAATGGSYTLTSVFSNKCLSSLGGATAPGTPVVQVTCSGVAAQRWTFATISGITYQIRTAAGTCVGAQGGSTQNYTDLALATCSTADASQRWTTNRVS